MDCPSEGRFSPGRALEGGSLSDGLPDGHAGCCGEERRFGWANFESTEAVGSAVCERGETGS